MQSIGFVSQRQPDAVEQLKAIWRACFDAEEEYLHLYFSTRYRPDQTLVWEEDGQILGMLTLLPCTLRALCQGEWRLYRASYLFAVGTLPQAQGRQIATQLLQFADKYLQEQGIEAAILYPAEPSLYRFYEKRGYEVWFSRSILSFPPLMQKGTGWELQPLSAGQYHREQLRLLPQEAVLWPRDALLFVKGESRLYRGDLYALCKGGQQRALCNLYRYTPDEVIVKELLAEPGQPQEELVQALRGLFPRAALSVRLPAEDNFDKWGQEPVPAGMVRWYLPTDSRPEKTGLAYLPFILD